MKGPQRREQRPPLTNRHIALGGLIALLFFVVLFTMVALAGGEEGTGTPVPDSGPGIEVDVDARHPKPAHSPQRSRSTQPGVGKAATPRAATATKGTR